MPVPVCVGDVDTHESSLTLSSLKKVRRFLARKKIPGHKAKTTHKSSELKIDLVSKTKLYILS